MHFVAGNMAGYGPLHLFGETEIRYQITVLLAR
jgi:hypothetical protein